MHINVGSETEPTKLQVQAEGERTDVTVTAPLAIHNIICNKKVIADCEHCTTKAPRPTISKHGRIYLFALCTIMLFALIEITVIPTLAEPKEENHLLDSCYIDDSQHSIGSVAKMKNGQYKECVQVIDEAPQWRAIKRERLR
ncbi:hypothetical protein ACO0LG_11210 [Undibacterium sp. Ji42W]|uniref:hypothetical protein n=1 Tax=Undibacterium sp. Ji42W TaxID=3413039 RepID=UPI003BF04511